MMPSFLEKKKNNNFWDICDCEKQKFTWFAVKKEKFQISGIRLDSFDARSGNLSVT